MRIGFDAKRAFFNSTGLGNYSRDSIRVLSKHFPLNQYFLYTPKAKENIRLSFLQNRENTFVRTPFSFLGNLFKNYWRTSDIVKDLQQDEIDIFHGLSHELPLAIEKTNIKSVVTIHDLIFIRYPHLFSAIDRKIYLKKFQSACNRADKIIAISQQTKSDIIEFLKIEATKIEVVYQGCNKVFQSSISEEKIIEVFKKYKLPQNFLLNVGTIEERKNLLTILKSIKELPTQQLVVIGKGTDYKNKCQKYISDNNLQNRITFLSGLELEEMAAIYQKAEIMIYPSVFEGFGIPILESLFCKTPVITSKGGCFSETGGNHSIYINPLSVSEITAAITTVKSDSKLRQQMIEEGYKYSQNFTDEKVAQNLHKIYTSL
ncbi:MAG: glycosyltransferase family 4 protein [Flavobacteriales bacterium]|jgi:glycosyltransferase involved in cell wall biosynthesis|nr:glycosyltransferase family 4 protein [Flavobacteriales bacterium]MBT6013383.1 glycosyltransferase family 4 protein [Flavobacteriales bacterium]MBT7481376.1 glycosyltransferase family 4 protein [Flavobacteriales bacterium]